MTKVIRNITNALEGAFRDWSVGLGIEGQLNELRAVVGLPLLASFEARERSGCHLDYSRLVRPEVVAATYKDDYVHAEDFFFRSVHLGRRTNREGRREEGENTDPPSDSFILPLLTPPSSFHPSLQARTAGPSSSLGDWKAHERWHQQENGLKPVRLSGMPLTCCVTSESM